MTLSAKHITELSAAEQAALPAYLRGPNAIIIRESRPGEGNEPRHFVRRAILALKGKAAGRNVARSVMKADALMFFGCAVATSMSRWSLDGSYDPLSDLRELRARATRMLGRSGKGRSELIEFRDNIASYIRYLEGDLSAAGEAA
ncbi:MAG: hypothetical protein V4579_10585 [Pseudomonadota bacterium]